MGISTVGADTACNGSRVFVTVGGQLATPRHLSPGHFVFLIHNNVLIRNLSMSCCWCWLFVELHVDKLVGLCWQYQHSSTASRLTAAKMYNRHSAESLEWCVMYVTSWQPCKMLARRVQYLQASAIITRRMPDDSQVWTMDISKCCALTDSYLILKKKWMFLPMPVPFSYTLFFPKKITKWIAMCLLCLVIVVVHAAEKARRELQKHEVCFVSK